MASLDREIDRLYQLPLAEFTKARDELAKREAADRAAIRRLEKPTLPAWAVNQLYWRDRDVYEGLTAAAERLRKAQVATLSGKSGDVDRAEAEHQAARKAAAERIRSILADSGAAATSVTLTAINETLDALPTRESPGRLLRPLKPMGFEGLAGLLKSGKIPSPRADVLPFKKPSPPREGPGKAQTAKHIAAQAEKDARRHVMERKKKAAKLTAELRTAEAGERAANAALAKTRLALAKAEHDHQQAAASLEASAARVEELNREARASERRASQAAIARADLEGQLKALTTDHP